MSRPMLVVFLFFLLLITSQFEWRQQLANEVDANSSESQKQSQISKIEEGVKEKIILSQEKNIQMLNELVRSLREQLRQCWNKSENLNHTASSLTERTNDMEQHQILDD